MVRAAGAGAWADAGRLRAVHDRAALYSRPRRQHCGDARSAGLGAAVGCAAGRALGVAANHGYDAHPGGGLLARIARCRSPRHRARHPAIERAAGGCLAFETDTQHVESAEMYNVIFCAFRFPGNCLLLAAAIQIRAIGRKTYDDDLSSSVLRRNMEWIYDCCTYVQQGG